MGIVIKQTLKGSLYSYLGVILGGINVAILFPILFSEEEIGLINILITVSAISAQFASLGSNGIINFFFPRFQDIKNSHNGFFIVVSLISAIGFIGFTIIYWIWPEYFLASKDPGSALAQDYNYLLYPLTFFTLGFIITDTFCASTLNAVIGALYKDVILRIVILALCLLYFFEFINFNDFIIAYVLNMAVPVVAILVYLIKTKHISLKLPEISIYRPLLPKMLSVGFFYILTGLSNILATYIDKYMINYFIGLKYTGIYSITNYFGALVRIPRSSMGKIATPLIAQAVKEDDVDKLSFFFEKSSIAQVLFGLVIFLLVWTNIDSILVLLNPSYLEGKWVVFYISLSHIFSCFLGVGVLIVNLSKHYKYSTYVTIILGVFVVIFNLILIPNYGITGAAAATAIAKFCFVAIYLVFLKMKMGIKVLNKNYLKIIPAALLAYIVGIQVSEYNVFEQLMLNSLLSITVRSILIILTFIVGLFVFGFKLNMKKIKELF